MAATSPLRTRIHAAPLRGRGWLNTGGAELSLEGLRGRFVLLDFWTFCCINCLHVLDELRGLEEKYADVLVIVGVHSPKFAHEADPEALAAAVERYQVNHPVLDDPELHTWQAYGARAWPTLTLIDPEGYVVAQMSGEGHAHGLDVLLTELVAVHEEAGTLHRGDGPYVAPEPAATALRFPGKVLELPDGGFLVSDTSHHQLVEFEADLLTERRRIGSGGRGSDDGVPGSVSFSEPQGLALLPNTVAAAVGYDVIVADTVNHLLRGLRLEDGSVLTIAGTGQQLRERHGSGPALSQALSSPWDVAYFDGAVVVAMAGTHQLWRFEPAADPAAGHVAVLAGTSAEGLLDGPAARAHLAQPSGLAASADGSRLWIADSETSALRYLTADDHRLHTAVGAGLFDFGHVDGPADRARLQHPLGVTELPDGSVAVADTYNGAVRRFDPITGEVTTLARGLAEPADVAVEHPADGPPLLIVVESAAHRLVRVPIPPTAPRVRGGAMRLQRPPTEVAPGTVTVRIDFTPPTGQRLDDRFGDPTELTIGASPEGLLAAGAGTARGLVRELVLAPDATGGVLHISVRAAACDGDPVTGEVPEFAACHLYQQDWGIPIAVAAGGTAELTLPLRSA